MNKSWDRQLDSSCHTAMSMIRRRTVRSGVTRAGSLTGTGNRVKVIRI